MIKKKSLLIVILIIAANVKLFDIHSQQLFSIEQNKISLENIKDIESKIVFSEINSLPLTKNFRDKEVYQFSFSAKDNSKIIVLNQQNANNVVITPTEDMFESFHFSPFFIEELKQSVLGETNRYLILEVSSDFSVKNVASISASNKDVSLPRYFYGNLENVKEAFPKDRQIIAIFKEKPILLPAFHDDPHNLSFIEKLQKERSYYVYMYKLPDGTITIYDEHFNIEKQQSGTRAGTHLQFNLTGNLNSDQTTATLHALGLWSEQIAGTIPVDIRIDFISMDAGIMGESYRTPHYLIDGTYFPSTLANQLLEYNFAPTQYDIRLEMNSNFNFYHGITENPSDNQKDWITVLLHEITHNLGFNSLLYWDKGGVHSGAYVYTDVNGMFYLTDFPGIFDRQLFQGTNGLPLTELNQIQRADLMVSNNLFSGANNSYLLEANNGTRVKMFAPTTYLSGASISHWDNSVSFPTFMKHDIEYGFKLHNIGTREIGILMDMGWLQPITFDPVRNPRAQIVEDNVVISWVEPDTKLEIDGYVVYRLRRFEQEEYWTILSDNVTQLTYTDYDWSILPGANYQYAIKAKYFENYLSDANFTNPLPKACNSFSAFPYFEGFENNQNNLPDCWTQEFLIGNVNWEIIEGNIGYPNTAKSGSYKARMYNNSNTSQRTKLVMSPMNLTVENDFYLNFWHTQRKYYSDQDFLRIFYKTSATAPWKSLIEYYEEVDDWTQRTIKLPELSENYYIAFEGETLYGRGIQLDDISITTTTSNISNKLYSNIYLYPNPFDDKIFVNNEFSPMNIQVINSAGKVLIDKILNENSISTKDFPKGVYFVFIKDSTDKVTVHKMIKK